MVYLCENLLVDFESIYVKNNEIKETFDQICKLFKADKARIEMRAMPQIYTYKKMENMTWWNNIYKGAMRFLDEVQHVTYIQ